MPAENLGPFTGRQLTTIIIALIAGAVLIPTGASAVTALTHVDIQDKVTRTPAGVTPTGNLKVAEAAPGAFFQNGSTGLSGTYTSVGSPPGGSALIVTTIHVDTTADPTPGNSQGLYLNVQDGSCSGFSFVGTYFQFVNPGGIGETDIPLAPGLGVPAGDALCAIEIGSVQALVSVSGYTVPAGTVAAASLHAIPARPQQR
jgi:hypothetical protein